jgi:ADP-ribose pyrophosphatase
MNEPTMTDSVDFTATDANLTEVKREGGLVFDGLFLQIQRHFVSFPHLPPDQQPNAHREFVVHPGAAMIIPMFEDHSVLIERQYRYPHQKVFSEFPAGKIDAGEEVATTAERELREETGFRAGQLAHLTTIHNAIAYSNERIELFVARDLHWVGTELDSGEFIQTHRVSLDFLHQELLQGRLTDVKTQIGLWWARAMVNGEIDWPSFKDLG